MLSGKIPKLLIALFAAFAVLALACGDSDGDTAPAAGEATSAVGSGQAAPAVGSVQAAPAVGSVQGTPTQTSKPASKEQTGTTKTSQASLAIRAMFSSSGGVPTPPPVDQVVKQWSETPPLVINPGKKYIATITLENGGHIEFMMSPRAHFSQKVGNLDNTVNNFVFLAQNRYFDGITFHRVVPGFVVQTGDPTGNPPGTGGPGYSFDDEFNFRWSHDAPGQVAMANRGIIDGKGTNGSQFYITLREAPELDGLDADGNLKDCADPNVSCHTVFGRVTTGMDVVQSIQQGDRIETIRVRLREN